MSEMSQTALDSNSRAGQEAKMKTTGLVEVRLIPNKDNRAQIMPIGDAHIGAATFDKALFEARIAECLARKVYVVGMGDMVEASLIGSVGDVYSQTDSPQEQIDLVIEYFRPLAEAGLLIGMHSGNHEFRITRATSIDVMGMICRVLRVPYLGHSAFHIWRVDKEVYTAHTTHGSSGARLPYSKIKAVLDVFRYVDAQIVCYGHLHGLDNMTQQYFKVDRKRKMVIEADRHAILTGSFLGYKDSYAEQKNLPPVKTGTALISLYGDRNCVHVSV